MNFLWPDLLWLLLALPLLGRARTSGCCGARRRPLRYASLSHGQGGARQGPGWRRHIPPRCSCWPWPRCCLAVARPLAVITLPSKQETIILAMDVSGSMRATDVQPNRLVAAQEAAKAFVTELPRHVRVGVVAFAGTAAVVQAPTHEPRGRLAAIDRFQLQRATAIGSGIVLSLATLFPDAGIDLSQITGARRAAGHRRRQAERRPSRRSSRARTPRPRSSC